MDIYNAIKSKYYKYLNEVDLDEFSHNLKRPVFCAYNYYQYTGINSLKKNTKLKPKKCVNINDIIQHLNFTRSVITKEYFHKLMHLFVVSSFPYIEPNQIEEFCNKINLIVHNIIEYGYNLTLNDFIEYEFIGFPKYDYNIPLEENDAEVVKNTICNNSHNYS